LLFVACPAYAGIIVSSQEASDLLGDPKAKAVDVRSPEEYHAGHSPGAHSLHVDRLWDIERGIPEVLAPVERLERLIGSLGITPADTLLLYGEVIGVRTAQLYWAFDFLGHPALHILHGGISAWRRGGHPLTTDVPPRSDAGATRYKARPDWTKVADAAYVLANLKNPQVILLDCRSYHEWAGENASQDVNRAGRIPGARYVDWESTLKVMCALDLRKCLREMAELYQAIGVSKDQEIITYARTGRRAAYTYLVLKLLGYPRVRVYDQSMVEWGNRPELPMERSR
jgi:thiosulfate/3-mercaptopyruvate sulfurtransferase